MSDEVELKLSAARTRLIIDKPFLGALVLRLPMEMGDPAWCKTTATDARKFYYNAAYIDAMDIEQTQFVLAHEALHCALSHFLRRGHREKHRWDVACDLAINPLLMREGFKLTPDAIYLEGFEGMTAEEIYSSIDDSLEQQPHDQHIYNEQNQSNTGQNNQNELNDNTHTNNSAQREQMDQARSKKPSKSEDASQQTGQNLQQSGTAPKPPPLSQIEKDNLHTQWQQRLAGAAQQAMQAGKLSGTMARLVDYLLQPQLPWRNLLAHYMTAIARDDYTYARPSTRRGDPAIYPSLRSGQLNVLVVIDTSGSIKDAELHQFMTEVNAIKSQIRARVTLHACDRELASDGPWVFEAWEEFSLPRDFLGGGGTSFAPVFVWSESQDMHPDLLVYFTDADGEFPKHPPSFPVLWLVKGRAPVPWGQRIQLN